MGLFAKKRHGEMIPADKEGRRFTWRIEKFSSYSPGHTLDSDNAVCFTKAKFHFHMTLGVNGDIGLYIHYKASGIPKYSYYFANSAGIAMRQHTAHTIPSNTERCGHWNACSRADMMELISRDDILLVHFCFDDDSLVLRRIPEENTVIVTWTVPQLFNQMLNPYSSHGFLNERSYYVVRLEVRKEGGAADAIGPYDINNIKDLVFFIFSRKGEIPQHSIELFDENNNSIAKLEKREEKGAQTLVVPKDVVMNAVGPNGALRVQVEMHSGGNPLNVLNALSGQQQKEQPVEDELTKTVQIGDKKEEYLAMNGDD
ncbi:uncharacterized protein TM35_000292210 [Trypanosoma theileri]|uniref:Uncharacterized protein n=1 Tax=Trypanosoma theileri TaxID=67003 RepID=A0A1X0NQ77_9TRYP|nr:uncharacterized protein TM35_000292210 [Trypanosoma theileri]ORC86339.1 hypothetical protein TM35_000292210 [Trypanosoma theileri]